MGDLGGDFFDYFNTSENRFSMLIGDVAGHGAGAALIMAMAKAGIMHFQAYQEKPAEILLKMHELICASHKNSKAFMNLQYLSVNSLSSEIIYANAGGWPPLIINPQTKEIREINLPGPTLGAMKRPRFSNIEFSMKSGEAIILYTDGIIEGRNFNNEILGIEGLKKIIQQTYDSDPQNYCERILADFKLFRGQGVCQDDITLLIMIKN